MRHKSCDPPKKQDGEDQKTPKRTPKSVKKAELQKEQETSTTPKGAPWSSDVQEENQASAHVEEQGDDSESPRQRSSGKRGKRTPKSADRGAVTPVAESRGKRPSQKQEDKEEEKKNLALDHLAPQSGAKRATPVRSTTSGVKSRRSSGRLSGGVTPVGLSAGSGSPGLGEQGAESGNRRKSRRSTFSKESPAEKRGQSSVVLCCTFKHRTLSFNHVRFSLIDLFI